MDNIFDEICKALDSYAKGLRGPSEGELKIALDSYAEECRRRYEMSIGEEEQLIQKIAKGEEDDLQRIADVVGVPFKEVRDSFSDILSCYFGKAESMSRTILDVLDELGIDVDPSVSRERLEWSLYEYITTKNVDKLEEALEDWVDIHIFEESPSGNPEYVLGVKAGLLLARRALADAWSQ
jgi:hypothetical protein